LNERAIDIRSRQCRERIDRLIELQPRAKSTTGMRRRHSPPACIQVPLMPPCPDPSELNIPPNTPRQFWNEGDQEAHSLQEFLPALRTEDFFVTCVGLARDGRLNEKGMPALLQLAVMTPEFGDEIRPASHPGLSSARSARYSGRLPAAADIRTTFRHPSRSNLQIPHPDL
jgi:hypothetical protein